MSKAAPMNNQTHRNLNPHKPARMAMYLFGERYAAQSGGSIDFWDKLSEGDKQLCRECVDKLEQSREES
jgi:hypothetical protein